MGRRYGGVLQARKWGHLDRAESIRGAGLTGTCAEAASASRTPDASCYNSDPGALAECGRLVEKRRVVFRPWKLREAVLKGSLKVGGTEGVCSGSGKAAELLMNRGGSLVEPRSV